MSLSPPVALTIAGSDSGGGAGIQADLRTMAFLRVHGASALTCVTAQNTQGVSRVDALPPEAVVAQIRAVTADLAVRAVKTGMLLSGAIMRAVATELQQLTTVPIVVDPVMVSRAGMPLIDQEAVAVLRSELLPLAQVLTPNRYEAQLLSGLTITSLADMQAAAQAIQAQGTPAVLVKGGGMSGEWRGVDVWWDGDRLEVLQTECVDTPHTHGTGCSLSAAIAAGLAQGLDPLEAVRQAKRYVTEALHYSLAIGQGQGPIGHFYPLLQSG